MIDFVFLGLIPFSAPPTYQPTYLLGVYFTLSNCHWFWESQLQGIKRRGIEQWVECIIDFMRYVYYVLFIC